MSTDFVQNMYIHLRAGYPVLTINSAEEVRCLGQIKRAAWMMAHDRTLPIGQVPDKVMAVLKDEYGAEMKNWQPEATKIKLDAEKIIRLFDKISNDDEKKTEAKALAEFLDIVGYPVVTWEMCNGFDNGAGCKDALGGALNELSKKEKFPTHCVIVFKDCHHHLNSTETPLYRRCLRNLAETNLLVGREIRRIVVFLQPDWIPHKDIDHCIASVDFTLPDEEQLDREISYLQASLDDQKRAECSQELRNQVRHSLRGFTQIEAQNALFYCLAKHRKFEPTMLKTVYRLKAAALGKDDVLKIVDEDHLKSFDQFGGFENYFEFIEEVKACYTEDARKKGVKRPKGCTLVGIPGTGKSLVAMATAKELKLPLIKFNLGAVYGSLVGQSEATMRMALRRITAQGPCVALIDEADKAVSGVVSSAESGDSGVSRRVFGNLLSWMANENEEAFIVMTMNRTLGVPPETLRAGRLDATFYTTFPSNSDREEILKIHFSLNNVDHTKLFSKSEWAELVKDTDEFVGAELEQLVLKALRTAYRKRKEIQPTFEDMKEARLTVSPMAVIDRDGIAEIDRWCKDRAIPVSKVKKSARVVSVSSQCRRSLGDPGSN